MNDPRRFEAPVLPTERLWQEADRLRAAHPAGAVLPVRVLDLAEFDLGLELIPVAGLREHLEFEALLLGDLRSLLLDHHALITPRLEDRLRFAVAHELGHLVLHRDIYAGLSHVTAQEWFESIAAIPDQACAAVEWQACEFAGRLLVPPEPLCAAFQSAQPGGDAGWLAADPAALDFLAAQMTPQFAVPAEVIARRLRAEKL